MTTIHLSMPHFFAGGITQWLQCCTKMHTAFFMIHLHQLFSFMIVLWVPGADVWVGCRPTKTFLHPGKKFKNSMHTTVYAIIIDLI